MASRNRMTMDQLRQRLVADGMGYDEFRTTLREEMVIERLRQRYIQSRVQVSEAEIDQLLAVREVGGPEVRLANIVVALPDGATADQIATAQKKISGVRDVIVKGELTFSAAAIRYSDAQNALEGGEIGWRGFDAIPPAFAGMLQVHEAGRRQPAGARPERLPDHPAGRDPRRRPADHHRVQRPGPAGAHHPDPAGGSRAPEGRGSCTPSSWPARSSPTWPAPTPTTP